MVKRLLIDAAYDEEVRVAVVNGSLLEEFESEIQSKKHHKSNIYLAKVIRVEPALQAAFVEYSGGRHGFLPFSEIHPNYYRKPVSDVYEHPDSLTPDSQNSDAEEIALSSAEFSAEAFSETAEHDATDPSTDHSDMSEAHIQETSESLKTRPHRYRIQEVIKRRQILLVQVMKEERGNKGASLTTYLSLAGRYCILLPNAGHRSGGISRRIENDERQRLREWVKEFEVPEGMSLIVRTAGQERNRAEIRRDYEYLKRLWDEIREKTLKSMAPALIYEDGDLIKRAIRDIYDRQIEEILIDGEAAFHHAKTFMKNLIPSHTKKIKLYNDSMQPIFHRFSVEQQIQKMHESTQQLPSGGSIVINHTEALVAIDVNSGRSIRERNIHETAYKTNLEAATEVVRQLRLRDIGGLIVVDFIDMQDTNHIQHIEKRMRELLKHDRARIQMGRISQFGLLELSRQRLKNSLVENHSIMCGHCKGTGWIRSSESLALQVLREIEKTVIGKNIQELAVFVPHGVDLYLLNQKRQALMHLETKYQVAIYVDRHDDNTFKIDIVTERIRALKVVEEPVVVTSEESQEIKKTSRNRRRRHKKGVRPLESDLSSATTETPLIETVTLQAVTPEITSAETTSSEPIPSVQPTPNTAQRNPSHKRRRVFKQRHTQTLPEKEAPTPIASMTDISSTTMNTPPVAEITDTTLKDAPQKKAPSRRRKMRPKTNDAPVVDPEINKEMNKEINREIDRESTKETAAPREPQKPRKQPVRKRVAKNVSNDQSPESTPPSTTMPTAPASRQPAATAPKVQPAEAEIATAPKGVIRKPQRYQKKKAGDTAPERSEPVPATPQAPALSADKNTPTTKPRTPRKPWIKRFFKDTPS